MPPYLPNTVQAHLLILAPENPNHLPLLFEGWRPEVDTEH